MLALLLATAALWPLWQHLSTSSTSPEKSAPPDVAALPLSFELNAGQTDPSVRFMAHASGSTLYFADSEVVIAMPGATGKGAGIKDKGLEVGGQVDVPGRPYV